MAKPDRSRNKPIALVLLIILIFALGFLMVVGAIIALVIDLDEITGVIPILATQDMIMAAIMLLVFAVIFFIIGIGLWCLRGWAKSTLIALAMISVVMYPALIAFSWTNTEDKITALEITGVVLKLLGIVFSLVILGYLSRVKVNLVFEAQEMALIKKKIRALEEKIELARQQCTAGEIKKAELSNLRSDCIAEERVLKAKIRHLEKVRLGRERKLKDKAEKKKEAKEGKTARKEEKEAQKEEKKAEKEAKEEEEKAEAEKEAKEEEESAEAEKEKEQEETNEEEDEEEEETTEEEDEEEGGKKKTGKKTGKKEDKQNAEEEDKQEAEEGDE